MASDSSGPFKFDSDTTRGTFGHLESDSAKIRLAALADIEALALEVRAGRLDRIPLLLTLIYAEAAAGSLGCGGRGPIESEDLLQEVLRRACRMIKAWNPADYEFVVWLRIIAFRICIDAHRRSEARGGLEARVDLNCANEAISQGLSPSASAEMGEVREALLAAADRLEPHQFTAFVCFYEGGLSCAEIAVILKRSEVAVRHLLHRARVNLKKFLPPEYAEYAE